MVGYSKPTNEKIHDSHGDICTFGWNRNSLSSDILVLFAIFAILWIGRDLRYGYSELKGMEHVMAVIIYLATIGLILGFINS